MYIVSAAQISLQEPLCDNWLDAPRRFDALSYNRAVEADIKEWISPMAARRMSPIVKCAIVTSKVALQDAALANVDAIIAGTGLGCVDNTEKFLGAMIANDEQFLQPTHFIQSTHNTIASQIAMLIGCNGYNSTYVHKGISFESALFDAYVQFKLNKIETALVGGYDEMTPDYYKMLSRIGFWAGNSFAGEGSVSFVLSAHNDGHAMAQISVVDCGCKLSAIDTRAYSICSHTPIEALMLGVSGDGGNDDGYRLLVDSLGTQVQQFSFKDLCGEYFTASAFGLYAAVKILNKRNLNNILFCNHSANDGYALILIERC